MKFLYLFLLTLPLLGQDPPRLKMSGGLQLRGIYYNATGLPPRRDPYTYVLSGNHLFSLYGMQLPFSYSISNQGNSFQQPFNRFGISPTYKWITLHAGYRNLSFSPYTLDGQTLLGAGLELRPGKFRWGLVQGRINKATAVDSSSGQTWAQSFHRTALAAYAGYEGENLAFNLSYLQAKDRSGTALDSMSLRPAANSALGAGIRWRFLPRLTIRADGGLSLYTRDRFSTLAVQPTSSSAGKIYDAFHLNATSEYYLAYSAALSYHSPAWSVDLLWKYVDPNFEAMGAYYFQNDVKSLSIAPKLQLLKGKLRFDASLGLQEDNVLQQKETSTRRIITNSSLNYEANDRFSIDGNFSNYSSNAQPKVTLVQNKYLLAQTNTNYSLSPRWLIPGKRSNQMLLLSFHGAGLKDLHAEGQDIQTQMALFSYHYLHQKYSLLAGINYTTNRFLLGKMKNYGWQAGANTALLKNALQLGFNYTMTWSEGLQGKGKIHTAQLNGTYKITKKQQLQARTNLLQNGVGLRYNEFTAELAYALNF